MKLAVTGKGGVGKTTVAAIVARTLARAGHEVVALDADPNPNLGISLGLGPARTAELESAINRMLRERVEHAHEHGHEPTPACEPPPKPADDLVAELGVAAPDGVTMVQTGTVERPSDGCLCCGSHGTTRRLFTELSGEDRIVLADLEAGVNDLIWARPEPGDTVLVVTRPYRKALEVAARAIDVSRELGVERILVVANDMEGSDDEALIRDALPDGLDMAVIPRDPAVMAADRDGIAALDAAPDAPAVSAVSSLAADLV